MFFWGIYQYEGDIFRGEIKLLLLTESEINNWAGYEWICVDFTKREYFYGLFVDLFERKW